MYSVYPSKVLRKDFYMSEPYHHHCAHSYNCSHYHHSHNHSHANENKKSLLWVMFITAGYMIAEFIGGWFAGSLALTADAGHMLGDVAALALSFFAFWLASKKTSENKTYGYCRAEIFAALINGITLILIAVEILREAWTRFHSVQHINAEIMMIVAFGGLLVNIAGAMILHHGSKENLNIKGAFFHVLGDLLGSVGAVAAGALIMWKQWYVADPVISAVIAILILNGSFRIIGSALKVLMEFVPENIDVIAVNNDLKNIPGVSDVHDLHIWSLGSDTVALSAHLSTDGGSYDSILAAVSDLLKEKYDIDHATVQIEPAGFHKYSCPLNDDCDSL